MKKCEYCIISFIPEYNEMFWIDYEGSDLDQYTKEYICTYCPKCGHENETIKEDIK